MRFLEINIENFRNIQSLCFSPHERMNVIHGENAQGKTNLIEALWILGGMRSFRGGRESDFIRFGENFCHLEAKFWAEERQQEVRLWMGEQKGVFLNGIRQPSVGSLCGKMPMVVFSPAHLSLVRDGPSERRHFIDEAIGQLYPSYGGNLSYYAKALSQRGALLRDALYHPELIDLLEVWDQNLAKAGAQILKLRSRYVSMIGKKAAAVYEGIAGARERLDIAYLSSVPGVDVDMDLSELRKVFLEALQNTRQEDMKQGVTTVGIHRDDLLITLDGKNARQYGSQGQQRSCVLALKLAECGILEENIHEPPVVLLDDVMSELDRGRRGYLLNRIENWQVFITCCEEDVLPQLEIGNSFFIQGGMLS